MDTRHQGALTEEPNPSDVGPTSALTLKLGSGGNTLYTLKTGESREMSTILLFLQEPPGQLGS